MSYITPSVLVYQQLQNAGGVANLAPDLPGVIVGPCYNVVEFDVSSSAALSLSKAATFNYVNGDASATAMPATLDVTLPSVLPGQELLTADLANLEVWFYDTSVETFSELNLVKATAIDAGGTVITLGSDPNALSAGGDPKVMVGDRVYLDGDTGDEEVVSVVTAVAATGNTITIADVAPLNLTLSTNFSIYVHRDYSAVQAVAGVSTSTTQTDDVITLTLPISCSYGVIDKAEVHVDYRALRTDTGGKILELNDVTDALGTVGPATDLNPLGLAASLALANTTTSIKVVSIDSDDLAGYTAALDLLEGEESAYGLAPLTQSASICAAFAAHVVQMSTPELAGWRIALLNSAIPSTEEPGPEGGYETASVILDGSDYLLQATDGSFISDGYRAGDIVTLVDVATSTIDGEYVIDEVLNNNRIKFVVDPGAASADVDFTVSRTLTKSEQAARVASISEGYGSARVAHIMPDVVGVSVGGVTKKLPGYYLAAALAGGIAGFPVQQGFTNISLAGFTDLDNSNFYFSRSQMNVMAASGTMLFAQLTQSSAPYCRHELMTDMSTLQYRELLKVKNLDYLSYYFKSFLDPFIGRWNITDDTLSVMRQTIVAAAEQLKGRKLPRIGAPLTGYNLVRLEQDPNNKDQVIIELEVATADPNNYTNLYLIV